MLSIVFLILSLSGHVKGNFSENETVFSKNINSRLLNNKLRPNKTYVLQAPGPGDSKPQKECKGIGTDCSKNAKGEFTQYEWDTFFPEARTLEELLSINIAEKKRDYVKYLQDIGFGIE